MLTCGQDKEFDARTVVESLTAVWAGGIGRTAPGSQ